MTNPISVTKPFCYAGTPNIDYQLPPKTSPSPIVTQEQCYPEQQEEPLDAGGTPVSRPQTNGLWYVATDNIAFQTLGGFYTFNADVVTNNNGMNDSLLYNSSLFNNEEDDMYAKF